MMMMKNNLNKIMTFDKKKSLDVNNGAMTIMMQ